MSGFVESAPTKKSRNGVVAGALRSMTAPLPSMVISDAIAGSAEGPYQ